MLNYFFKDFFNLYRRQRDMKSVYIVMTAISILFMFYQFWHPTSTMSTMFRSSPQKTHQCSALDIFHKESIDRCYYKSNKPGGQTVLSGNGQKAFRVAVVADLDEERSKDTKPNTWKSYLKRGILTQVGEEKFSLQWDPEKVIMKSTLSEKGRGFELSELVNFNRNLYAVDDRTGIVYHIIGDIAVPWVILTDGDGNVAKGFKGEWMTVKDKTLYVGGLGKEWTTQTGEVLNSNPQYVKSIGPLGETRHHSWVHVYNAIKDALGIKSPGYVIHEAVTWSSIHRRWYFLPRRASHEMYDDQKDEKRATNVLISCNENFKDFTVTRVGKINPTHGFSSFKFIPGTNDNLILALKSMEDNGVISTFALVFNLNGKVLMEEEKIADDKYEGIEFI